MQQTSTILYLQHVTELCFVIISPSLSITSYHVLIVVSPKPRPWLPHKDAIWSELLTNRFEKKILQCKVRYSICNMHQALS